jgi:hypothetical protein
MCIFRGELICERALFTRCLHLPIKLPQSDIRIPREYQQFTEVLQKTLDYVLQQSLLKLTL